ncbi:MAG: CHAT domain-containing protein [Bacteroidota bacterium]
MHIQIIEHSNQGTESFELELVFDEQQHFRRTVQTPHTEDADIDLEWYFEDFLREPFTAQTRVARIERDYIRDYGTQLFEQLFGEPAVENLFYESINAEGMSELQIELLGQSLEFQSVLWETLRSPEFPGKPLVASGAKMYRNSKLSSRIRARVGDHPQVNLLLVSARPSEENDIDYRTVQRPLIELINREPGIQVNPHVLRPGTFRAFKEQLDRMGSGYYHIVHFDLHGEVLSYIDLQTRKAQGKVVYSGAYSYGKAPMSYQSRWGKYDLKPFQGKKAFLHFESGEKGLAEPTVAEDISQLMKEKQIPVCILNACQSAKQDGTEDETSLGKFLLDQGVDLVLAMRYSVSVSATVAFMKTFYQELFANRSLEEAIAFGRSRLFDEKERLARFNTPIDLEDWALPIIYKNRDVQLKLRSFTAREREAVNRKKRRLYHFSPPTYGFKGRDLDILKVEKLLSPPNNHLLVRGMVKVGKSTLLKYLAQWWGSTSFRSVLHLAYFDFRSSPLSHAKFVDRLGKLVFAPTQWAAVRNKALADRRVEVLERLNQESYGLLLDNLHGFEDKRIIDFLSRINGASFVVYGSVGPELALSRGCFGDNWYQLDGLDMEAANELAGAIIQKACQQKLSDLLKDKSFRFAFDQLMRLLAGFPSAMEAVLPLLSQMNITDLLEQFRDGTLDIDW